MSPTLDLRLCLMVHLALLSWLVLPPLALQAGPLRKQEVRLLVDFSPNPAPADLLAHNVCLLDADCRTDFSLGRRLGHLYLARLPVLAVTPGSEAGERAVQGGFILPGRDAGWERLLLDPLAPGWLREVETQAKDAARRGFAGLVIEGAEALAELDALRPEKRAEQRAAFLAMVRAVHRRYPDLRLVLHRGFDLLAELQPELHGVFVDGLFRRSAETAGGSCPVAEAEAAAAEVNVRIAQSRGLKVYVAEPGDATDAGANRAAADRLRRIGCAVFVAGPGLRGAGLGPQRPESREVIVLHGWDPAEQGRPIKPARETWTARELEPALRWFGLKPRYVSLPEWWEALADPGRRAEWLLPAGVIVDADTEAPEAWQEALASWLARVADDAPLILAAQPLTRAAAWDRLAAALHLEGDGQEAHGAGPTALSGYRADWFQRGRFPDQRALRCQNLRAGGEAERILSYRQNDGGGAARRYDVAFTASWGGAWLARSAGAPLDAFHFVQAALRRGEAAPVPDTSTLAGRRIFLSTVQGEGFCEPSWLPGGRLCAEVLREELEKMPGLPVTVAVAEADIRGWSAASEPAEAGRYEAAARALFALPQVEPAANTLSRPAAWQPGEFQPGPLRAVIPESRFDLEREIAGSLDFVRRRLTPPGKSADFLLWPQGGAPGAEALALLSAQQALHLPDSWQPGWCLGGTEANAAPGAPAPAPAAPDDPEALAAAWVQSQGGAGQERRAGPAHLAFSFADLRKPVNVQALRRIWAWCAEQPLHPMTAAGYARFLADSEAARVYPLGENHWRVISSGRALTLRLPAARGLPDLARSFGVRGYRVEAGQLYLHLAGREVSEIVLRAAGETAPHLHLVEADRLLDFQTLRPDSARFRVQGRDPARVTLGGLAPGAWYQINASGAQARLQAGETGELVFQAPPLATIQIQPSQLAGKPYAAR